MKLPALLWTIWACYIPSTNSLALDREFGQQVIIGGQLRHFKAPPPSKQQEQQQAQQPNKESTVMASPRNVEGEEMSDAGAVDFDPQNPPSDEENTRYEDNLENMLLYRVWYDDDAAWTNYLRVLSQQDFEPDSDGYSDDEGEAGLDVDYDPDSLPFTIMDNRDAYANASKDEIRNAFRAWVAARSPERDGKGVSKLEPPAPNPNHPPLPSADRVPRYRFCYYIDRDAVLSAKAEYKSYNTVDGRERRYFSTGGYAVLIDSAFDEAYYDNPNRPPPQPDASEQEEIDDGDYTYEEWLDIVTDGDTEFPPVEGRESKDVGWCFVRLPSYYLHESLAGSIDEWDRYYKRPPRVFPGGELLSELR